MTRYRSRPVEIEAACFLGVSNVPQGQMLEFDVQAIWLQAAIEKGCKVRADYVARSGLGQIFGCKADLFAQLYEAIA